MSGPTTSAEWERTAVEALTAAARLGFPEADGRRLAPDFAEVLCRVVATVAANLGGLSALLAARPGSWEADLVRQIVLGTAGDDELTLLRFRSEPLRLPLDIEAVFTDLGLTELFWDDYDAALDPTDAGDHEDELEWLAAEQTAAAIEQLYQDDQATYTASYLRVARDQLAEWGRVDLELTTAPSISPPGVPDELAERLHTIALARTPLPATNQPPDWGTGNPADAVRAAGRTYRNRVG